MHFVDLLPYERGHRVAASYDALRFPEDKDMQMVTQRDLRGSWTRTMTRQDQSATAKGKAKAPRSCRSSLGRPAPHALGCARLRVGPLTAPLLLAGKAGEQCRRPAGRQFCNGRARIRDVGSVLQSTP